jgi:tRNA threonylcarbamoyladenosine biosynthesis protein TsaE
MSIVTNYEIKSPSSEFSQKIGECIGRNLKGGELIILSSDLGGGKTTLTKGIAKGAGSADLVSSPSFTLTNVYRAKNLEISHYDFYRLSSPGVLLDTVIEDINDNHKTVIIEWADIVINKLNVNKLVITINSLSENIREIKIVADEPLNYLLKGIDEISLYK